jgi:hypothetical protein
VLFSFFFAHLFEQFLSCSLDGTVRAWNYKKVEKIESTQHVILCFFFFFLLPFFFPSFLVSLTRCLAFFDCNHQQIWMVNTPITDMRKDPAAGSNAVYLHTSGAAGARLLRLNLVKNAKDNVETVVRFKKSIGGFDVSINYLVVFAGNSISIISRKTKQLVKKYLLFFFFLPLLFSSIYACLAHFVDSVSSIESKPNTESKRWASPLTKTAFLQLQKKKEQLPSTSIF